MRLDAILGEFGVRVMIFIRRGGDGCFYLWGWNVFRKISLIKV